MLPEKFYVGKSYSFAANDSGLIALYGCGDKVEVR